MERLKSEIKTVYGERCNIRKNLVDTECLEKEMMEKLYRKQKNAEWMNLLCQEDNKTDKVETRVRKCLSATKSRLKHLNERKEKLHKQLKQNGEWLKRTQDEIKVFENVSVSTPGETPSFLTVYEASCVNELRSNERHQECKYYKKCVQNYETQRKREKRLIDVLLKFVKKQFMVLKSSGMATNELTEEHDNIVNIVEDNREVAWADQTMHVDETPERTPLKPQLSNFTKLDLTPRRLKTPTLTLSATLPVRKVSSADHLNSPSIAASQRNITTAQRSSEDNKRGSVRQNLLNVLDQTGSSLSFDLSSTNSDVRTVSETFQFTAPKISAPAESKGLRKTDTAGASLQTGFGTTSSSKPTTFNKRPYSKPTVITNRNVNMGRPLREQSQNSLNIKPTTNELMSTDSSILRQKTNTSFGGNESGKKVPSYASLTKSAAQKITSRDMLPKRSHPKENSHSQPKRSKLPARSASVSCLLTGSMKRQQHHISGLKRAVSVLNMRK